MTDRKQWEVNKRKYDIDYQKKNLLRIELKINRNTEQELIQHLEQFESKTAYIKNLIIEDMQKKK